MVAPPIYALRHLYSGAPDILGARSLPPTGRGPLAWGGPGEREMAASHSVKNDTLWRVGWVRVENTGMSGHDHIIWWSEARSTEQKAQASLYSAGYTVGIRCGVGNDTVSSCLRRTACLRMSDERVTMYAMIVPFFHHPASSANFVFLLALSPTKG